MSVTLSELMLNVKDISMKQLVFQNEIKTNADIEKYREKGYRINLTEEQFKKRFELPVDCIAYTPSVSYEAIYFNRETLAALSFPISLYMVEDDGMNSLGMGIEKFYQAVKSIEQEVANGDYIASISSLPDKMRLEYFELLIKRGIDFPDFYEKFFSFYIMSDYGFSTLSQDVVEQIVARKTEKDWHRTRECVKSLPDIVTIYRGQTKVGTPLEKAYSWTVDKNIACFFACRMGTDNVEIVEARVSKDKIIEYDISSNEQEVFVKFEDVEIVSRTELYGLDKLKELLPQVEKTYNAYKNKLNKLHFTMDEEGIHGKTHTLRVLFLCLLLAKQMGLSIKKTELLATAAIYHDTCRENDGVDIVHGYDAMLYYKDSVRRPEPIVKFLIEYHAIDDRFGYRELNNNPDLSDKSDIVKMLFEIFKDADALDRVRFGISQLDLGYLRTEEAKHFPLIARICCDNIKT